MRIRLAIPDELDDYERRDALNAALESVTQTAAALVRRGLAPTAAQGIRAGVKWKPEPPGDEHFDLPTTIMGRKWGDCDDLAPWHAGSLRATGTDPQARAIVKKSGPQRWHALVQRGDGSIEDPSRAAGMNHSVSGVGVGAAAPVHRPMAADGRLCLAISPTRDPRHPQVWFARCDVSDRLEPWAWSSNAAHPNPAKALLHTIKGVRQVAGTEIDPDDDARLAVLHDLVSGARPEDIGEALAQLTDADDDEITELVTEGCHGVGFLSDLWKGVKKTASSATQFIPAVVPFAAPAQALFSGNPGEALKRFAYGAPLAQGRAFVRKVPAAAPYVQAGLPMAFGPAGQFFADYVAPQQAAASPTPIDPRLFALLAQHAQQRGYAPPTFRTEPGIPARPFGPYGPAVLRF